MLWTVKDTARYLGLEPHQVYYLVGMGEIESVKVGKLWRLEPEGVDEYAERYPERTHRKPAADFIYTGGGGFLFRQLSDCLPPDPLGAAGGVEGRRKQLVRGARRHQAVLLAELEPVRQLELFTE